MVNVLFWKNTVIITVCVRMTAGDIEKTCVYSIYILIVEPGGFTNR